MLNLIKKTFLTIRNYLIYKKYDFLAAISGRPFTLDPNSSFVVSIASYPQRSHLLPAVIHSVVRQSRLPRYLFLVLSEEEWPAKELPKRIKKLARLGVRIIWTSGNTFSVKMLVPIIELNLNLGIVTLGDDWIYGRKFIENTVCSDAAKSGCITGPLGKALFRKGQELNMYFRDSKDADRRTPSEQVYLLGLGTIYPPDSLDPRVTDMDAIRQIVPGRGSDIWFWAAAKAKGTRIVCLGAESVRGMLIPIPETKSTKPKDAPGIEIINNRFQLAIDFFGIRQTLLDTLPDRSN